MSLIKKPHEIALKNTLKVLVYGQPKIGKTTLALSAPNPLLLDFDDGVNRVSDEHRCDTVQIESWSDVIEVLKEDLSSYESLIIDTAGKMLDFMSAFIIKNDSRMGNRTGALTLQGYGARRIMFQQFVHQISHLGKHLIFVAHEKEEKDGDVNIKRPEIGGSSQGDLLKDLDLVGYVQAIGSKRTISFDPCEKFYAGNTCGLEPVIQLDNCTKSNNTFFKRVFERQHQSNLERAEKLVEYGLLLDALEARIGDISNAEEANEFIETMKKFEHMFDSRIKAGKWFSDKTKELGLVLNKEIGIYEKNY